MDIKLFDSELKVMDVLWKQGDTPAREIARALGEELGWNVNTTYTLIKRCMKKGAIERSEPGFFCHALIPKSAVQEAETDELINKVYDGSADKLFAALLGRKKLSDEQIERYAAESYSEAMCPVVTKLKELTVKFSEMQARVEAGDKEVCGFKDFHARRLVETAGHIIITYLLARQAGEAEEYAASARVFCKLAEAKIAEAYTYVMNSTTEDVALFKAVENEV